MIDCHFHLRTEDVSSPEKRAERADQVRTEADRLGFERVCLMGSIEETIEECHAANRVVAKFQEEHPDLFFGWTRVHPPLDGAAAEFRRAVEEDGLIGLKHHFTGVEDPVNIIDPEFAPLAEAAADMDVPIICHVMERHPDDKERWSEKETYAADVAEFAESYPDVTLISAHIGAGGFWEKRIKTIEEYDNVYLDTSGSNTATDTVEMAADRLGIDRLVYGTDGWLLPGVGRLEGAELTAEEKAEIAYKTERLLPDSTPNKRTGAEIDEREADIVEQFERRATPRDEQIIDANAYVGNWAFRDVDGSPDGLIGRMDRKGVDQAVVSSLESAMYRNAHAGNRKLKDAVDGYRDRLIPFATINPTYPAWEEDLEECIIDWDFQGVRLLPAYHDYDVNDPAVVDLLDKCAALDVPAMFVATLEDLRGRHWRVNLHGMEGASKHWKTDETGAFVSVLQESPEADVIIANGWQVAEDVKKQTTESYSEGVSLKNKVRDGETLFVLDDLYMFATHQGEGIVDRIGVDHLVSGPQMPLLVFDAHYIYTEQLPVSEADREQVSSGNIRSIIDG